MEADFFLSFAIASEANQSQKRQVANYAEGISFLFPTDLTDIYGYLCESSYNLYLKNYASKITFSDFNLVFGLNLG